MLARAIYLVLVLFSTLGQTPFDGQQKRVILTCQSKSKVFPCKDLRIPLWTTAVQADTGPHSLISGVNSYTCVPFMFLDPVFVISMTAGGVGLLFLLGAIAWAIIILVWIVCTAFILRINPLTRKRIIIVKHYVISGKAAKMPKYKLLINYTMLW